MNVALDSGLLTKDEVMTLPSYEMDLTLFQRAAGQGQLAALWAAVNKHCPTPDLINPFE